MMRTLISFSLVHVPRDGDLPAAQRVDAVCFQEPVVIVHPPPSPWPTTYSLYGHRTRRVIAETKSLAELEAVCAAYAWASTTREHHRLSWSHASLVALGRSKGARATTTPELHPRGLRRTAGSRVAAVAA